MVLAHPAGHRTSAYRYSLPQLTLLYRGAFPLLDEERHRDRFAVSFTDLPPCTGAYARPGSRRASVATSWATTVATTGAARSSPESRPRSGSTMTTRRFRRRFLGRRVLADGGRRAPRRRVSERRFSRRTAAAPDGGWTRSPWRTARGRRVPTYPCGSDPGAGPAPASTEVRCRRGSAPPAACGGAASGVAGAAATSSAVGAGARPVQCATQGFECMPLGCPARSVSCAPAAS